MSIPYNQALRVSRILEWKRPSEKDFRAHICRIKEYFLVRCFPEKVVNDQTDKVVFRKHPPVKKFSENGRFFWLKISFEN